MRFDVNDDKFGEIPLPDGCGLPGGRHRLAVFKRKLALISFEFGFRHDTSCSQCLIWVLEEYGVHELWNKFFFLCSQKMFHLSWVVPGMVNL